MPPKKLNDRNRGIKNFSELNELKFTEEYAYYKLKSNPSRVNNVYHGSNDAHREEKFKIDMPTSRPSRGNLTKIGGTPVSPVTDHEGSRVSYNHQSSSTKKELPKGQVCLGLNQSKGPTTSRSKGHLFQTASATAVLQATNQGMNSGELTKRDVQLCLTCLDSNADGLKTKRILDWLRDCENADAIEYSRCAHSRGDKNQNPNSTKRINAADPNVKHEISQTASMESTSELFSKYSGSLKKCPSLKSRIPSTMLQVDNALSGRNPSGNHELDSRYQTIACHSEKSPVVVNPQLKTLKCWNPLLNASNSIVTLEKKQLQLKQKLYDPRITTQENFKLRASLDKNPKLRYSSKLPIRSSENLILKSGVKWLNNEGPGTKTNFSEQLRCDQVRVLRDKKKQDQVVNRYNSKSLVDYATDRVCDVPCRPNIKSSLSTLDRIKNQTLLNQKKLKKRYFLVLLHCMLANRLRETKARIFFNQQLLSKSLSKWRSFVNQTKLYKRTLADNLFVRQHIAEQLCHHKLLWNYFWKWYWWTKERVNKNNTRVQNTSQSKQIHDVNLTNDKRKQPSTRVTQKQKKISVTSHSTDITPCEYCLNCDKSGKNSSARASPTSSTTSSKSNQNSVIEANPPEQKSKCTKSILIPKPPEFLKIMERRAAERRNRWAKLMQKKMESANELKQENISNQKKKVTTQQRRKSQATDDQKQIEKPVIIRDK